MKLLIFRLSLLTTIFLVAFSPVTGNPLMTGGNETLQDSSVFVSPFDSLNNRCFTCHGQQKYEYTNASLGKQIKENMCTERIIHRNDFYSSNHRSFNCTDCHSEEYSKFPHAGELRMEQKYNCLDCHGGDENYAKYHFEEIDSMYQKSVHYKLENEGFTCWKCHDPHTYKISVRNPDNLKATIAYDNAICLNCHSDYSRFQLLSEKEETDIIQKHEWLPNQASHFASVRCIECHAQTSGNIPVPHLLMQKEQAVRLCNECHSQNSLLMASLYKFESKEQRADGFLNGIILNTSFVIGANRNEYLNILSLIIFAIVIAIIVVHIVLRIRSRRNIK